MLSKQHGVICLWKRWPSEYSRAPCFNQAALLKSETCFWERQKRPIHRRKRQPQLTIVSLVLRASGFAYKFSTAQQQQGTTGTSEDVLTAAMEKMEKEAIDVNTIELVPSRQNLCTRR